MISFKDVLNESRRKELTGIEAVNRYEEIKDNKREEYTDNKGERVTVIMAKDGIYHVYYNAKGDPMFIIANPTKKEYEGFKKLE